MFIYMVVNDALLLTLVTTLYVVSYIFFKIHASICCLLVKCVSMYNVWVYVRVLYMCVCVWMFVCDVWGTI